jgi:hypothetical protein
MAAVLKTTEDIRSNMEDGQVTLFVLLDFSQAFDMVIHGLLLCEDSAEFFGWGSDVSGLLFEW